MLTMDTNFPNFLFDQSPFNKSGSSFWPVSAFTLRRNLSHFSFPQKLSKETMKHVTNELTNALLEIQGLEDPTYIDFCLLDPAKKEFLLEHYFIPHGIHKEQEFQGFVTDKTGAFLAGINLSDHLTLQMIDCSGSWHQTWELLRKYDKELNQRLNFAFSERFGYLTSNYSYCGTGLSLRIYLHLPALLQLDDPQKPFYLEAGEDFLITHMGDSEEEGVFQGDLVVLENKRSLGVSEDHMLHTLFKGANTLINQESECRTKIKNGDFPEIKNLISRSFGVLMHSYQLATSEALSALSLVKLGVDLKWIEGVTDQEINQMFFKCRRGHLIALEQEIPSQEEILHKRAQFIHLSLSQAKLTI